MSEGGEGISIVHAEREPNHEASGNVNEALKGLRKRSIESIAIRDGNTLIQSAIRDLQEHQPTADNAEKIEQLRELDKGLLELGFDSETSIPYHTAKGLRSYFKEQIDILDTEIEDYQNPNLDIIANRNIYATILHKINEGLPTLEAALSEYPTYSISDAINSGRIELPANEPLTFDDIKKFYEALERDISTAKTAAEADHPHWVNQKQLLRAANEQWANIELDQRKPLLITKKGGRIEVEVYDPTKTHIDKKTQYIVDPVEDMEYFHDVGEFDDFELLAQEAVIGLEKLQVDSPTLSPGEYTGLYVFLGKLGQAFQKGELNDQHRESIEKLGKTLHGRLKSVRPEKNSSQLAA